MPEEMLDFSYYILVDLFEIMAEFHLWWLVVPVVAALVYSVYTLCLCRLDEEPIPDIYRYWLILAAGGALVQYGVAVPEIISYVSEKQLWQSTFYHPLFLIWIVFTLVNAVLLLPVLFRPSLFLFSSKNLILFLWLQCSIITVCLYGLMMLLYWVIPLILAMLLPIFA